MEEVTPVQSDRLGQEMGIEPLGVVGGIEGVLEGVRVDPAGERGLELDALAIRPDHGLAVGEQALQVVERLAQVASRRLLVLVRPEDRGEMVASQRLADMTGEVDEKGTDLLRLETLEWIALERDLEATEAMHP
ncbi:MAG: hypothetical protein VYE73_07765 [Acidobacteriota bacterium]|nr:hypothetical protein [Acidobacteriota bacterium]